MESIRAHIQSPRSRLPNWKAVVISVLCPLCSLAVCRHPGAEEWYALSFSTYLGGSNWEHARDVFADGDGNVYIVGGTASADFPTTPKVYDRTFDPGYTGSFGPCDAFIAKFGPGGNLIWSTYLGGPNYDRAYGVEVDAQGYVYVCGRAGPGFPVTAGAFQTTFKGFDNGGYGWQNCFVAKLKPDGSDLVWASYAGVGSLGRDMAIDSNGDIYVNAPYPNKGIDPPSEWYANAYQATPRGGSDCGVMKIKSDGSQVLWATFLGGSGNESNEASVRIGLDKSVYLFFNTQSTDMPTTAGAHDRTHNGGPPDNYWDTYAARLSADGSSLIYGTYLGGSDVEWAVDTHTLALDPQGNAYLNVWTASPDFPTTPKAFDRSLGGSGDIAVTKLSPTGALLKSTFIGGSGNDNSDGIYADASGNVFLAGTTDSSDFPITPATAYQTSKRGSNDAVIVRLSAGFGHLLYSTYMGGDAYDNGRSAFLGQDGSLYLTGAASGPGWPTKNAHQDTFAGGGADWGSGDNILAKFIPPNPALRIDWISVWNETANLVITNLTASIPYTVQRTDRLAAATPWTDINSFIPDTPSRVWEETLNGMSRCFYRVRSGN